MKHAVIFDFGGVLMKTEDYSYRHRWDDRLGLARGQVEQVVHGSPSWRMAQTGTLSVDDYWADVAQTLQLSPEDLVELKADFFRGDRLDLGLIDYIRELRERGHTIALLSNDSPALIDKLRDLAILELFDPLVISALIGVMKPAPPAYQYVLTALGRPAQETIFIDDMPDNIAAAQALGIHGLLYHATLALKPVLESKLTSVQ
ncbi:MAG: HAD family phosphatase [Anaerolineae bacterium]|jgi:HAD superfamily hydrolase (TIGR01509 family)|nr:HAD family phosphatase [Anaerolineae bacterium]